MDDDGHDVPMCDMVAAQLVGHETRRFLPLTLQEFPKESPRRAPVPAGLDEDVDQITVLVNRTPEILALTVDRDEDFVQKPRISESTLSALQLPGVIGAGASSSFSRSRSFAQTLASLPQSWATPA